MRWRPAAPRTNRLPRRCARRRRPRPRRLACRLRRPPDAMTAALALSAFPPLTGPIGFYPVVPDAAWVQRLLGWGVRTIQLRCKAADLSLIHISEPTRRT